ncbi:MAG: TfuA-related McrA-glycine thioamidation protein [Nostoc sp.]|uniref:TfuA-related McrA-glycine thioamidation protein n=1 Tax=Nostoc sp. TaxID=1180 RepID=UPI002FF9D272
MNKIVIFLGPSLPKSEARKILDAVYLPPAKQADLISAVATYKPDIIGLIDGVFYQCPSVWHKEILYAIEQGVAVYGASSMGALRAAETAAFGMVGIGEIYRMYASEELIDDDEVALIYGPEDKEYRPSSEPMVNVRSTFRRAQDEGIISESLAQQLTAIAKSIYFPERTFATIFRQAATVGVSPQKLEEIANFIKNKYVDIKRQDAILLLENLRDLPEKPAQPPNFTLARNHLFSALYQRDRTVLRDNTNISLGTIAGYVALHLADFDDTNFHALNRALVQILAALLGIEVSEGEVNKEIRRFRLKHALTQEAEFTEWLNSNDLSLEGFNELMCEMACCRRLQTWLIGRKAYEKNIMSLLNELRLQNRYDEWADAAAKQEQILQKYHPDFIENNYDNLTMPQLVVEHLRSTDCRMNINYKDWEKEAGFLDLACMKVELLRSRLAREAMQNLTFKLASINRSPQE